MSSGFSCRIDIPDFKGLASGDLTVGREFLLVCDGPWPTDLQVKFLKFELPAESEYQIKLLAFQFATSNIAQLKVTSYIPAEHRILNLKITDGVKTIELGEVQFSVRSVLPKPEEGQQGQGQAQPVEPFSSIGPVMIPIPWQYFFFAFLVIGIIGSFFGFRLYLRSQRKALLKELAEHDSAMTPVAQFHHTLRRLRRENVLFLGAEVSVELKTLAILDLEKSFKLYLTRKFRFPANRWTNRQILREMKNQHKEISKQFLADIAHLFKELDAVQKAQLNVPGQDIIQISKEMSTLIERLDAWKPGEIL